MEREKMIKILKSAGYTDEKLLDSGFLTFFESKSEFQEYIDEYNSELDDDETPITIEAVKDGRVSNFEYIPYSDKEEYFIEVTNII